MTYILIAVIFLAVCAISAGVLWGVVKLFNAEMAFLAVLVTVLVAELLSLIPFAGWIISVVAYYFLLYKLSSINSVFMCWVITIVARLCNWALLNVLLNVVT
jgi:hypothetical protein